MVEYRRFAVGILMICIIVTDVLVLPVISLPSWIFGTRRRPMASEVPLLNVRPENLGVGVEIFSLCSRTRDMPGGNFPPPPVAGKRRKKRLPGVNMD